MAYEDCITVAMDMLQEYLSAEKQFQPFNSTHEGYAVIKEELDELWDLVKDKSCIDPTIFRKEAIQIGAMAIRFIMDCLPHGGVKRGALVNPEILGE